MTEQDKQNFDENYQAQGWNIVEEMQEKFIDLCVDDNHSYDNGERPKQEDFCAHLAKLDFRFQTHCMDLPAPMAAAADEGALRMDKDRYADLKTADTDMGDDLDAIFELIAGNHAREQFKADPVIIEHNWNDSDKKFIEY